MTTLIIYDKQVAEKYIAEKPKVDRLYPLTPDALSIIKDNVDLPIIKHHKNFSDYSHMKVMARSRKTEKKVFTLISQSDSLSLASIETFKNIFHVTISSIFYLWYSLSGTGPWIIYDFREKKWIKTSEQSKVFKILFFEVFNKKAGVFNLLNNKEQRFSFIFRFINFLTFKTLPDNIVWTTGPAYGTHSLCKSIQEKNPGIRILHLESNTDFSLKKVLKTLVNPLRPFRNNNSISIMPIKSKVISVYPVIKNVIEGSDDSVIKSIINPLSTFLSNCVNHTESLKPYINKLFIKKRPIALVAWHLRWLDVTALAEVAKLQKVKSILITHGTHRFPDESSSVLMYELDHLAKGLLVSSLADITISQSPSAYKSIKRFMPKLKNDKFQPIMYGGLNKKNMSTEKNQTKFTILHAGTYKPLGIRPWIFETSNEFVYGLKQLVTVINELDNIELVIRIRDDQECSIKSLNNILPEAKNFMIKSEGSFEEDLITSDMVISFSSTTIEESLYARKPVGLFGGTSRYRHFDGSSKLPKNNSRSAIYHLTKDNMLDMLRSISDAHSNRRLTDNEIIKYVWPNSIPSRDIFVSKYF